jgi:hypothetical protein
MLAAKKGEIRKLTEGIFEFVVNLKRRIKLKLRKSHSILSLFSVISTCTNSKNDFALPSTTDIIHAQACMGESAIIGA